MTVPCQRSLPPCEATCAGHFRIVPRKDQKYCLYDIFYAQLGAILAIYNDLRMRTF